MMRALALLACACGCDSGFAIGVTVERGCLPVPATLKVFAGADPCCNEVYNQLDGNSFFAGQHRLLVIPPDGATSVTVAVTALDKAGGVLGHGDLPNIPVEGHALVERTLTLAGACNDGFVFPDLAMPDLATAPDLAGADLAGCTNDGQCKQGAWSRCCGGRCVDITSDRDNCGQCGLSCGADPCNYSVCGPVKRVFLTSFTADGNLGGLAGADALCQGAANLEGLGGTWQAWLSDGNGGGPSTRWQTHLNGRYLRLDGEVVAESFDGLLQLGPLIQISLTETGNPPPPSLGCSNGRTDAVWTATTTSGNFNNGSGDCGGWSTNGNSAHAIAGAYGLLGALWTDDCVMACDGSAPLYCFEQ